MRSCYTSNEIVLYVEWDRVIRQMRPFFFSKSWRRKLWIFLQKWLSPYMILRYFAHTFWNTRSNDFEIFFFQNHACMASHTFWDRFLEFRHDFEAAFLRSHTHFEISQPDFEIDDARILRHFLILRLMIPGFWDCRPDFEIFDEILRYQIQPNRWDRSSYKL